MSCPFSKNNAIVLIIFALLALVLGIGLNRYITEKHKIILPTAGTPLPETQALPEFNLVDGSGYPFTRHSLEGHYSFLFFGYTHCQGICPMTLSMLTQLYTTLKKEKLPLPHVVFITLDPKRDTQYVVAHYVKAFNPAFKGVTGPRVGIQQLSKQMGVVAIRQGKHTDKNYQIDHSGTLYLINPAAELIAVFSPPYESDSIINDYKTLLHLQK